MHSHARPVETRHPLHPIYSCGGHFGVKYMRQDDIEHLIKCIKEKCKLTMDWDGNLYCGICLTWDYDAPTLDISMPGYILKQLQKYKHATQTKQQIAHTPPSLNNMAAWHNNRSPRTRPPPSPKTTSNKSNA